MNGEKDIMHLLSRGIHVLLSLSLTACVAKVPLAKQDILAVDPPASYSSRLDQPAVATDWINQLSGDRVLKGLIEEVKENNWDIKKAAVRVETAAANAKIAGSKRFPILSTGLEGRRAQQTFIGFPFGEKSGGGDAEIAKALSNSFGASLNVSWEVDLWGRIRAGQEAYIAEVQAAAEDLRGVASSLAAQTAKIWFALLEADEQIALSEKGLVSFRETHRTLRDAFESGSGSASQVRVASADVETARALLADRRAQKRAAQRQLEILLGRYPAAALESMGGLPEMPAPPPPGVPSGLLLRRSDVVAAERRLTATHRRIKEAKLALFPQIKLTGSGGTASASLQELTNSGLGVWSIAGGLGQQIFRDGEILGNLKLRKLAESEAYIDYQRAVLKAFGEVETRLDNEVVLRKREEALRAAEEDLIDAFARSMDEYRGGVGNSTSLLLTQRQMLAVRSQVLTLRRMRLYNRVNLHLALGGSIKKKK